MMSRFQRAVCALLFAGALLAGCDVSSPAVATPYPPPGAPANGQTPSPAPGAYPSPAPPTAFPPGYVPPAPPP